jgi:hypothetical protein
VIGTTIDGRYEVGRRLGAGSWGEVYLARDTTLDRDVAIKLLSDGTLSAEILNTLGREARALARMNHPNVVTVHDCGDHQGRFYMVLEYVAGRTLESLLGDGAFEIATTLAMARGIATALSHAHDHGVIHGDLKLANIMRPDDGHEPGAVKVLDFGVCRLIRSSEIQPLRARTGTPAYMAPEQFEGRGVDERTDIFAFAGCVYRLLEGRAPFKGEYECAIEYEVLYGEPRPLSAQVPRELASLLTKCLARDPADRLQSFADVAEWLERVGGIGSGARPSDTKAAAVATVVEDAPDRVGNPYLQRTMISDPRDFYGRRRELRRVFARLNANQPQSVSVVGDRRVGKSSLLCQVAHEEQRARHMSTAGDAVFVFLDFQNIVVADAERFIGLLLDSMPRSCRPRGEDADGPAYAELEATVANLHTQGGRLIVVMDEFEKITGNASFEQGFFSFMRSLANRYRVAYVTSSVTELQQMCHNRDISDSPFFNIFSNLQLGAFTRDEAEELVRMPSARTGRPLEPHGARLIEMAGTLPMHLQIACSSLWEHLEEQGDGAPDWESVTATFAAEMRPHYEFAWNRASEAERALLVDLVLGRKVDARSAHRGTDLRRRGLLCPDREEAVFCGTGFRNHVLGQVGGEGGGWLRRLWGRDRS